MPRRADQARDIAVERFDLDDVGAVIAEHLGGIGPHQHGRHVDDLDALEWSHGAASLPMRALFRAVISGPSNGSPKGRSRLPAVWAYAWRKIQGRPGLEPGRRVERRSLTSRLPAPKRNWRPRPRPY